MMNERTKSTTARAISAESWRLLASPNSSAMTLASVAPGAEQRARRRSGELPSSRAMAIVSPTARPRPSAEAPTMPERAQGSIALRTISQRVAPRRVGGLLLLARAR